MRWLLLLLMLTACGKTPTAVERACITRTITGPILNAQGDSVSFTTFKSVSCAGGRR